MFTGIQSMTSPDIWALWFPESRPQEQYPWGKGQGEDVTPRWGFHEAPRPTRKWAPTISWQLPSQSSWHREALPSWTSSSLCLRFSSKTEEPLGNELSFSMSVTNRVLELLFLHSPKIWIEEAWASNPLYWNIKMDKRHMNHANY